MRFPVRSAFTAGGAACLSDTHRHTCDACAAGEGGYVHEYELVELVPKRLRLQSVENDSLDESEGEVEEDEHGEPRHVWTSKHVYLMRRPYRDGRLRVKYVCVAFVPPCHALTCVRAVA